MIKFGFVINISLPATREPVMVSPKIVLHFFALLPILYIESVFGIKLEDISAEKETLSVSEFPNVKTVYRGG